MSPATRAGLLSAWLVAACGYDPAPVGPGPGDGDGSERREGIYRDVTASHLPAGVLSGLTMDAEVADLDGDGDLDIVVAHEFGPNILLLNDGSGRFSDASQRLPRTAHDSEDVGFGDFDGDGDLDVVVVSEDDRTDELYLNDGAATFADASDRMPARGVSNAVAVADIDGDGAPDLIVGNAGQNFAFVNDGEGGFRDETATRLPPVSDVTQDVELGDVDGDGDLDLLVGNEDDNRLLLNDGSGHFVDVSDAWIPRRTGIEETREADFGDIDGDGDLDVFFANVASSFPGADAANRLLVNVGDRFDDATAERLPPDRERAFDGDFWDLDGDGDLDILTSNFARGGGILPWIALLNDGTGRFTSATDSILPASAVGLGFDAEMADFDGDGLPDLYLVGRGTQDRLLLRRSPG